jgi:amino acid transporter
MRRSLSRFDVTCLGLNAIVGSGIFLLPDDLYREMGVLSPLAFLLCAIGLLPVALCYAEAASYGDATGGPYLYARDAFGAKTGFLVVWMCFVNAVFSFAAVAAAAAAYADRLVPGGVLESWQRPIGAGVIALFALLNYVGAKPGAIAVDAFTIAKFAVLIVLVVALVPDVSSANLEVTTPILPHGWSGVGAATFVAVFAAQGFEVAPVPAGETRAPQRDLPVAIVLSLLAASLLYVIVQLVLVASGARLSELSDTPLVDAALSVAPALAFVVVVGGLISTLGFVSGSALGTPRYLFAAAADRHLPSVLGAVHPRFGSPHVAILATAVLAIGLVASFDYRSLIGISNVAVAVQYLATCAAVPVLRRRGVPGRRVPGGPIVPLLGAAMSLWVFTEASRDELTWATVALALGVAVLAMRGRTDR